MMKTKFNTCGADVLSEFDRLSSGNPEMDKVLKGGFRNNILNEIVGTAGSGKTQICLYLSLMVQVPKEFGGLNKAAVYFCTEDVFPIKRLHEMSFYFEKKYNIKNTLENVYISHISDCEKLKTFLHSQMRYLAKFKDIGLIVIDSIGGLFRSDTLEISYDDRSRDFSEIAMELRKLGSKLNCTIICCNQMTYNLDNEQLEPCLGLSWSNLVNSRFHIARSNTFLRTFEIQFSPDMPPSSCNFSITKTGIN